MCTRVNTVDLAKRTESLAQLGGVELRLLPGGEVRCEASSTPSFSGQRVAAIRARRSSRSASGKSTVNGRIAVASIDASVVTAMLVLLLVGDGRDGDRAVSASRPWEALGRSPGFARRVLGLASEQPGQGLQGGRSD